MPKSMREQLSEAMDQMDLEAGGSDEDTEESLGDTEEEEDTGSAGDDSGDDADAEEEGDAGESGEEDAEEGDGGDHADEDEERTGKSADDASASSAESDAEARAPVSWRPSAREVWKDLPPAAKEEVLKREREIQQGLEQASQARRFTEQFHQMVRPFEGIMKAEGARNPLEGVQSLLQTGAALSMGQQSVKAQTIANLIKHYGVDIETLDGILAGEQPQNTEEAKIQQMLDQRLKPVQDLLGQVNQQRAQQSQGVQQQTQTEIQQFAADPKNEFFNDVRNDMADILEMAARRGENMSLQDAYDRACYFNPEVRKVVQARGGTAPAGQPSKATMRRKRAAASSVSGRRSGGTAKASEDLRSALEDAWEDSQR